MTAGLKKLGSKCLKTNKMEGRDDLTTDQKGASLSSFPTGRTETHVRRQGKGQNQVKKSEEMRRKPRTRVNSVSETVCSGRMVSIKPS